MEQSLEPDGTDVTEGDGDGSSDDRGDDGTRGDDGSGDDGSGDDGGTGDDGSGDDGGTGDDGSGDDGGTGDDGSGDDGGTGDDGSGDDGGTGDDGSGDDGGTGDDGSGDDGGTGDDGSGDDGGDGDDGDDDGDDDPPGPDDGGNVGNGGNGGPDDPCEGHEHDPATDSLIHVGTGATGTNTFERDGSVYKLRFEGDEVLEYQIDTDQPEIRDGLLRVYEATSASFPIAEGGPGFRTANGQLRDQHYLTTRTELVAHSLTENGAILEYVDSVHGLSFRRRHVFSLEGKALRIRVHAVDATQLDWAPNYAGVVTGPTDRTFLAKPITMQGTLSSPTVHFRNAGVQFFTASFLDLTRSHASDFHLADPKKTQAEGDQIDLGYDTLGLYSANSAGELAAPLDETIGLIVSKKLSDVFLAPTQPASPFRRRLSDKTVVQFSGHDTTWPEYREYLEQLHEWGVDNLAVYPFFWWSASLKEGQQNVGPDWYPATDEQNFIRMASQGLEQGYLMGVYTLFMGMPTTSPQYNDSDVVRDDSGSPKFGSFKSSEPFQLASDSGVLDDVRREANALKDDYGLNMIFVDVSTYWAPSRGASGSQIDQAENSGLAQTLEQAIIDRKRWLTQLKETIQGPVLGEGSIGTHDSNMEWLWSGYCDSTQRVINTGSGKNSVQIPADSPLAQTAWHVIPEYEYRIATPRQAHHGNGFYYRFFGPADGPLIFDEGADSLVYPLSDAALDTYRLYELTYGHTSYYQTNGPSDGNGDYLGQIAALKEYYMVNAIQEEYLESRVDTIHYDLDGQGRTFEEALQLTGSLDAFLDPRIRITFASGFTMYLNHSDQEWVVDLPTGIHGDTRFILPEDGFLAYRPGSELFAFSGWTPEHEGSRFDYANKPGQYEFFDGRRAVAGYGNLTTEYEAGIEPKRLVAVTNHIRNLSMIQTNTGEFLMEQGPTPTLTTVQIEADKVKIAKGEVIAVRALARFDNGAYRDVSSMMSWTVSDDSVVHISPGGAVVGCRNGNAVISASPYQGAEVVGFNIKVGGQ